jgi:hypothetical protein
VTATLPVIVPSIRRLVIAISLDLTENLILQGIVNPLWNALPITVATQATPIVVTIPTAPSTNYPIHALIQGELSMPELDGMWILTPTSPGAKTFTVTTTFDPVQGQYVDAVVNSVGVNPYGGLATATTALNDGRIVLGKEWTNDSSAPPRVIFVPTTSRFYGSDTNDRSQGGARANNSPGGSQTPEQVLEQAARMVAGETVHFEVEIWGAASPPEPEADFEAVRVLSHQLVRTLYYLDEGNYNLGVATFLDQTPNATQHDKLGHKLRLPLEISTPVLDYVLGSTQLETIDASIGLEIPNQSSPETGWSGTIT